MSRILDRIIDSLVEHSGPTERVEELAQHIEQDRAKGQRSSVSEVLSMLPLVGRWTVIRFVRDLPFWIAGLPLVFLTFMTLVTAHVTHFNAWDVVSTTDVAWTGQSLRWKTITELSILVAVVTSVPAGRRVVEQCRRGRWTLGALLPAGVLLGGVLAMTLTSHLPDTRDGGVRAEHVNELSSLSIGMFLAIAALPALYLIAERLISNRSTRASHRPRLHGGG